MKRRMLLYNLDPDYLGQEIFQHLCDLYPGVSNAYSFAIEPLDADDPRSQQVLDYLAQQGWFPNPTTRPQRDNEFGMNLDRLYDTQDLEQAEYLTMFVNQAVHENTAQMVEGRVVLRKPVAKANKIARVPDVGLVVSDRIKTALAREELHHISFLPTEIISTKGEHLGQSAYWQMVTDLLLPPVSPTMRRVHCASGAPLEEGEVADFYLREGLDMPEVLYMPSEIHYVASDLRSLAPFDLALSQEKQGRGADFQIYIASQHLYQVLSHLDLDILWHPVRLEED